MDISLKEKFMTLWKKHFYDAQLPIVYYPYLEAKAEHPRTVVGMFDISARLFAPKDTLTFSAPMSKFIQMIDNMEESFLILPEWGRVQRRIK